jgi:hypothetical protein
MMMQRACMGERAAGNVCTYLHRVWCGDNLVEHLGLARFPLLHRLQRESSLAVTASVISDEYISDDRIGDGHVTAMVMSVLSERSSSFACRWVIADPVNSLSDATDIGTR